MYSQSLSSQSSNLYNQPNLYDQQLANQYNQRLVSQGQNSGQTYGQNSGQIYGQNSGQTYGQNYGQSYGQNFYYDIDRMGLYEDYPGYDDVGGYGDVQSPSPCSSKGINPFTAILMVAGAAVGFYFLYERIKDLPVVGNTGSGTGNTGRSLMNTIDTIWTG